MNLPLFIARRIAFSNRKTFSSIIIRIAIAAIALSISVMLLTTALVKGFKNGISNKVFGFWGHIHVTHFDTYGSFDEVPIDKNQDFYPSLDTVTSILYYDDNNGFSETPVLKKSNAGIKHIQVYANKAGIIKTKDQLEGIVLKGVGKDYNWDFLKDYLIEGEIIALQDSTVSKEVIISNSTAKRLKLKLGDKFIVHFVQDNVQLARQFIIKGIYKTGLEEFDKRFALIDIRQIQKLNKWSENEVTGFEIFVEDIQDINLYADYLYNNVLGLDLNANTIREVYSNLFGWLDLQNTNERVIMILMIIVSIINMTTALLILILERTNMIGILKALGNTNWNIRKVFLYQAAYIIGLGLFWGNLIGLSIGFLQKKYGIIKLPEESYYLSVAPVEFDFWTIILLNVGTLLVTLIAMMIPSWLVTRITPLKAIRFK